MVYLFSQANKHENRQKREFLTHFPRRRGNESENEISSFFCAAWLYMYVHVIASDFRNWIPQIPGKSKDRRCARFYTRVSPLLPQPLPNGQTAAGKTWSRVLRLPSSISNLRDLGLNLPPVSLAPQFSHPPAGNSSPLARSWTRNPQLAIQTRAHGLPRGASDTRDARSRAIPVTQRGGLRAAVDSRHR